MAAATQPFSELAATFEQFYGTQMVGTFLVCVLYGVLALQVFIYYVARHPTDPFLLKCLPGWLVLLETVHVFVYCVAIFKAAVNNFGNPGIASLDIREIFAGTIFQGWITISAHMFFIYRIWKFGNKPWIVPIICVPLTTTSLGLTLTECIMGYLFGPPKILTIAWITYTVHSINMFLDTTFVVAMIWLLKKENSAFEKTNHMINRLIILVINTGLATTIVTSLLILFLSIQPDSNTFVIFNVLVSPLYCNSVMANLNSREYLRGRLERRVAQSGNSQSISAIELGPMALGTSRMVLRNSTEEGFTKL